MINPYRVKREKKSTKINFQKKDMLNDEIKKINFKKGQKKIIVNSC